MTVIGIGVLMFFALVVTAATLIFGIAGFCVSAGVILALMLIAADDGGTGPY